MTEYGLDEEGSLARGVTTWYFLPQSFAVDGRRYNQLGETWRERWCPWRVDWTRFAPTAIATIVITA